MLYCILLSTSISLAGTGIFLLIFWMDKYLKSYSMTFLFRLIEGLFFFFLIPAVMLTAYYLQLGLGSVEPLSIISEDFQMMYRFQNGWGNLFLHYRNHWSIRLLKIAGMIWLLGVLIGILRGIFANYTIQKTLSTQISCFSKSEIQKIRETVSEAQFLLGLKSFPSIMLCLTLDTPVLYRIFHSKIFLNRENYTAEELKVILLHEGTHYKRKDILFKNIASFISIIYWFNPIIKLLVKEFFNLCELSCDERVITMLTKEEKNTYAKLIGEISSSFTSGCSASALKASKENIIVRRLKNMLNPKKKSIVCMLAMSGILAITSPTAVFASNTAIIQAGKHLETSIVTGNTLWEQETSADISAERIEKAIEVCTAKKEIVISPKGFTSFSVDLNRDEIVELSALSLSAGDTVKILISGSSSSDKFKASLADSSGTMRSISSSNGEILHNFKITKADTYRLLLTSTTSGTIHLNGSVSVQ